jgi:hypothetical protein
MDCYYINLDAAILRKVNLENSFHPHRKPDWNLFRKLVWTERSLDECRASLELMKKHLGDEESEAFGVLFAAMASAKYRII